MNIADNSIVSLSYTLKTDDGDLIDSASAEQPLLYLHGHSNIVPGLEKVLTGKRKGDSFSARISPADGYGSRREELVHRLKPEQFQGIESLTPGMQVQTDGANGPAVLTVTSIDKESVTVDGNHPLAGLFLRFEGIVQDVRPADPAELQQGYPTQAYDEPPKGSCSCC